MRCRSRLRFLLTVGSVSALGIACTGSRPVPLHAPEGHWISLFNGRDLSGWTVKIAGHEVGDNFGNTFRVDHGLLKVAYDQTGPFGHQFGSLFYNGKFSRYWVRVEYRFVGDLAAGAPAWTFRDSGLQLHSQSPQSMKRDQEFPVCVEFNFLGGRPFGRRPTGDVCTSGTHVTIQGKPLLEKCGKTSTLTTRGDEWVTAEAQVLGDTVIRHGINGRMVAEYEHPQLDLSDPDAARLLAAGAAKSLSDGYLSLQSNGHPIEFRRIEILPLDGEGAGSTRPAQ